MCFNLECLKPIFPNIQKVFFKHSMVSVVSLHVLITDNTISYKKQFLMICTLCVSVHMHFTK